MACQSGDDFREDSGGLKVPDAVGHNDEVVGLSGWRKRREELGWSGVVEGYPRTKGPGEKVGLALSKSVRRTWF